MCFSWMSWMLLDITRQCYVHFHYHEVVMEGVLQSLNSYFWFIFLFFPVSLFLSLSLAVHVSSFPLSVSHLGFSREIQPIGSVCVCMHERGWLIYWLIKGIGSPNCGGCQVWLQTGNPAGVDAIRFWRLFFSFLGNLSFCSWGLKSWVGEAHSQYQG